jgi:hypothetical protein
MTFPSSLLKFAEQIGYEAQVVWAKEAASKSTWVSPQSRSGIRPLRVDTMLRKEKDGTLVKYAPKVQEKDAAASMNQIGGPGGTDFSEPALQDPGQAKPPQTPTKIPSREDTTGGPRREDGRDFAATLPGPGTFLNDTGPQPAYIKTSATPDLSSLGAEHLTDLGGLGLMATGSASKLYGQLADKGVGPLGEQTQRGLDLAGLASMSAPTVAALGQYIKGHSGAGLAGGGGKYGKLVNVANLAGLGALAVPTADKIQAHLRAGEEDPEKKMLLGHGVHKALELGGLGALTGASVLNQDNSLSDKLLQGVGYGALATPIATDMKDSPGRTALELGGLGALAIPSARSLLFRH